VKFTLRSGCAGLIALALAAIAGRAAEAERSVVQIIAFSQPPAWDAPWRFQGVGRGTGSGFVIKGRRIMTNAHVVSWARQILIRKHQDPRPYLARVAFVAHDCDLALLDVDGADFFSGLEPLEFGELPKVRSTVVTYGYPAGGEQISYTRGVVSRIEVQPYVHSGNRSFLTVQTDAAINPGNSGGPVMQDDKIVGIAFQGTPGLENTGFFIPPTVAQHFLKDTEDGKYHGFPTTGARFVPFQNPAYRRYLKVPDNGIGARLDNIFDSAEAAKVLRTDDVVLQVGGYTIGSDGTIMYQGNRVQMTVAFHDAQHGDSVPVKVWREGREHALSVPMLVSTNDARTGNQYDTPPRYYVHGGLVFTPLSLDYLKTFGRNWSDAASAELIYNLSYRRFESPGTSRAEPIVLAQVLPHPANANFRVTGRALVDRINGVEIHRLEDVIRAIEGATGPQHVFEFMPKSTLECLGREDIGKANDDILKTYGIPRDRRL